MSKLVTNIKNNGRIETFDLSQEEHNTVVKMINNDLGFYGKYHVEYVDDDKLDTFIENADDEEYKKFLTEAKEYDAEVYTLFDDGIGYSQPIGEIAIY